MTARKPTHPSPLQRIRALRWNVKGLTELGRGGEAVAYQLPNGTVAKVFHKPDAPEYGDNPGLQDAARVRIVEMQTKLDDLPRDLPPAFVAPTGVLVNGNGNIFGYVMPFIDGVPLDQLSRRSSIGSLPIVCGILAKLHEIITLLHVRGIVVGDCNENNIIVSQTLPHFVDVDAMQFGQYPCRAFMPRYAAPELIGVERPKQQRGKPPQVPTFTLVAHHSALTDWYAFLVIAMRLITRTDPYGGTAARMDLADRIEQRVTVFDRRVTYPAVARPLAIVPRPILEAFVRTFPLGERFIPDRALFETVAHAQRTPRSRKSQRAAEHTKGVVP